MTISIDPCFLNNCPECQDGLTCAWNSEQGCDCCGSHDVACNYSNNSGYACCPNVGDYCCPGVDSTKISMCCEKSEICRTDADGNGICFVACPLNGNTPCWPGEKCCMGTESSTCCPSANSCAIDLNDNAFCADCGYCGMGEQCCASKMSAGTSMCTDGLANGCTYDTNGNGVNCDGCPNASGANVINGTIGGCCSSGYICCQGYDNTKLSTCCDLADGCGFDSNNNGICQG